MRIVEWFETRIPIYEEAQGAPPAGALGFILHFVRQTPGPFIALLVVGGLFALVEAAMYYFTGRLVDLLATADRAAGWDGLLADHGGELLLMLVTVAVVRTIVTSSSAMLEEQTIAPGFFNRVRWQNNARVSRQSIGFFSDRLAGMVAQRVWQSGQATGDLMITLLQVLWYVLVYATATVWLVGSLHWSLAAIVVAWIAIFSVIGWVFLPRIRARARKVAEVSSETNGKIVDSYGNVQTVRLFSSREADDRFMRATFEKWVDTIRRFARMLTATRVCLTTLSGIAISAMAFMSLDLWLAGAISVGAVAFTLGLVLRLSMMLNRLMMQANQMLRMIGTIQNSAEIVAEPISVMDGGSARPLVFARGEVRFDDVQFAYNAETVIGGVTLHIRPGERVGLVGRSGAGKSTLVNLLLRFYDLDSGLITVDGQSVADITQDSLRAKIGMITQDTALLHRSVRDNVALARPDATDAEIIEALRRAEAWEFVRGLRDQRGNEGLDAFVGERGVKLSGGQRQRIAIARVMLKDAPILVLDEATSALDSEVEAAIQANLDELMAGKTVIAIAHRLSTIAALDRLVVMDQGEIVEEGRHDELLARGGLYAQLWARQSGGFLPQSLSEAAE